MTLELAGFASPGLGLEDVSIDELVESHARAYAELFLERYGSALRERADGLEEIISVWANESLSFETAWHESVGRIPQAVLHSFAGIRYDPLPCAAGLASHLSASGCGGSWKAEFSVPVTLRWGPLVLANVSRIDVDGHADEFVVRLGEFDGGESKLILTRTDDRWHATAGLSPPPNFRVGSRTVSVICANQSVTVGRSLGDQELASLTDRCHAAVTLIDRAAPDYSRWIEKLVDVIEGFGGEPGAFGSASQRDRPGVVALSFPIEPIQLAESLIHESSHQLLYILGRLEPLDDGSDKRLYFSPIAGPDRPIEGILLAFHAFVNIGMFYGACLRAGIEGTDADYCARNLQRHRKDLDDMLVDLRASTGLSSSARAVVQALEEGFQEEIVGAH